ncbi:hypothetical protein KABACHOK_02610 [Brevundimonas phage vB_BpoS-Kabachok]|uniref:Uncharacterized protein n=1 Tax=Brevundimonas phage vB_BpoS-Kabachok TaxID=2948600 RepID=A0A9E7SLS9_9CAUD|nr:hypothetical protein KABACHOK_02610 [Brevundimonas phage vB_BpoS-Kabachok]
MYDAEDWRAELEHREGETVAAAFESAGADPFDDPAYVDAWIEDERRANPPEPARHHRVCLVEGAPDGRQRFVLTCDDGAEADVVKAVAKLDKRMKRYNQTVDIVHTEETFVENRFRRDRLGRPLMIRQVLITIEAPAVAGENAKLIGAFEMAEDNVQVYRHAFNGADPADLEPFLPRWRDCDHCGHKRDRRASFLVETTDGRRLVIGRQCSRDFLGLEANDILAREAVRSSLVGDRDDSDAWGGAHATHFWVEGLVRDVYQAAVRYGGYGRDIREALRDDVLALRGAIDPNPRYDRRFKEARDWHKANPLKEPLDLLALVDYVEKASGDFGDNLRIALSCEYARNKRYNIILAGVAMFVGRSLKRLEDAAIAQARPEPKHLKGDEGGRYAFTGRIERCIVIPSQFGPKTVVAILGDDGSRCVHFATGEQRPQAGKHYRIKATIKKHTLSKMDGKPETVLTRAVYDEFQPGSLI